jgi:hypothetical protein
VRRLPAGILVAGLCWFITPGLTEAAENLWHLLQAGHTAHSPEAGADHDPAGDEPGCSGTFHLCACHHSVASDLVLASPAPVSRRPQGRPPRLRLARASDPDLPLPYHPPQV